MSAVYTYSDARQHFASILEQAMKDGKVRVRRKDGQVFVIIPERSVDSPFAVEGVEMNLTTDEIVGFVREGRREYFEP
jgi:prevent-host-death family protein